MLLADLKVTEFVDLMASSAPAPGGGSAAALSGALGASLTAMVCALTDGKKNYAEHQPLIEQVSGQINRLKSQFVAVMDRDTQTFEAMSAVFAMPKETDTQKADRKAAMQLALRDCTQPPYEMMTLSLQALELTRAIVGRSNKSASSDLGCAALALKAAIQSAWLNVRINIGGMEDTALAEHYREKGQALLDQALPLADGIYQDICNAL